MIVPGPLSTPRPKRRAVPVWLRLGAASICVAVVVWFLVLPQFNDAEKAFEAIENLSVPLLAISLLLQVTSLLAYSLLSAAVLGWRRLRYGVILRIDLSSLAVNHTVPGGGAVAGATRFRLLVLERVPTQEAFPAATVQISISALALATVFLLGVLLSAAQIQSDPTDYLLAGGAVLVTIAGVLTAVWALKHREGAINAMADSLEARAPRLTRGWLPRFMKGLQQSVHALGDDHRRLRWAVAAALANWLLDAASLWVMLAAVGEPMAIGPLLTVYGLGSILALIPLTPGGIGVVEAAMVPALIGFGVPASAALLGVIGWRLVEYWLPIPAGAIAYLTLRVTRRSRTSRALSAPSASTTEDWPRSVQGLEPDAPGPESRLR